ncbi:MAG: PepSY-associated TM helix domain-containing protein [Novosphingobium sp.]
MQQATIRTWFLVHKWSSIVSTLFLVMLCVTGLPLIFHDEIEALADGDLEASMPGPASASDGKPLDVIVAKALAENGGGVPLFIGFSQESPLITVTAGPRPDAAADEMRLFSFNRTTGESVGEIKEEGVMHFLLQLHTDMFLGLPGMLFLGVMGFLFVVAIASGVVLYVPFMRRLRFGTLRTARSARVRRLDYHNLLGVVTLGWALVVGLTGIINAFADPLTDSWREGAMAEMMAAYKGQPPLDPGRFGSIDTAMAAAKAAQPGLSPQFIGFPGGAWSSAHHYAIFFQGDTPLTSHVLTPALVDAETGKLTDMRSMPPLNQALMLSKPLHFGDYGGLPLKLLWALLDIATIWVLVTGLYLWLGKRANGTDARVAEIATGGAIGSMV